MSVVWFASSDGDKFSFSRRAATKLSISLRIHRLCLTSGTGGRCGVVKAQCSCQCAPSAIQVFSLAICSTVSFLPLSVGGMTSSSSLDVIRAISVLCAGSPGAMAISPDLAGLNASSLTSNRSLPLRAFSSGPWQAKQYSDRIGRISRLKSMEPFVPDLAGTLSPKSVVAPHRRTVRAIVPTAKRRTDEENFMRRSLRTILYHRCAERERQFQGEVWTANTRPYSRNCRVCSRMPEEAQPLQCPPRGCDGSLAAASLKTCPRLVGRTGRDRTPVGRGVVPTENGGDSMERERP